jgi:hypothetical protein
MNAAIIAVPHLARPPFGLPTGPVPTSIDEIGVTAMRFSDRRALELFDLYVTVRCLDGERRASAI